MLRLLFRIFFYALLFVAFITFGPSGLLLDIQPQSRDATFPPFTGPLAPNNILSSAQKLFVDQLLGPESLAVYNGSIFTGSRDGFIYKIDDNNFKLIVRIINTICPNALNRTACGCPLGLKFDSKGVLYVVEPSHGIYTVDVFANTPKVKQILDIKHTKALGKQSVFFDDIAIDESGGENGGDVLYISDVSTKYDISNMLSVFDDSDTGRIISYNTVTKKLDTVFSGLLFANGVELTDDRSAVLVLDCVARKLYKHFIRGPKAGQTLVIIPYLPGEPDNIRRSATKSETYWIAFASARNESNLMFFDTLNKHPLLKKFLLRFTHLIGSVIDFIGNTFANYALRELGFGLKSGHIIMGTIFINTYGMVIEVDANGKILQSLHSPDGSVTGLSEAREVKTGDTQSVLYLGSFFNKYLGKLVLNNRI